MFYMKVLKFGGSSVASAENMHLVVNIIRKKSVHEKLSVVVSAMGGVTDTLLQCGADAAAGNEAYKEVLKQVEQRHLETIKSLIPIQQQSSVLSWAKKLSNDIEDICNGVFLLGELSPRSKDRIASYGELISSGILSHALRSAGLENTWKDSRELIITDSGFTHATVEAGITQTNIQNFLYSSAGSLFVLPGFIAADARGATTTLGRGGSDYTAALVAAAAGASSLEIWTDVSGIMTADPRLVPTRRVIPQVSYQEAMELSHFGAKVIYPPTIQPVMDKNIPVLIKNTFAPDDEGTVIETEADSRKRTICGISSINEIALLSLEGSGMIGIPGFSKRLFEALAASRVNVILITQGSSEHSICVGVEHHIADAARQAVDAAFAHEIETGKVNPLFIEKDLAVVALVGENMKSHPGISGKMFGAIGRNGVNVRAIAQGSSERNITAVISSRDVKKAINVLHEEFFETTYKQIHLFITGVGNVGSRLLSQLGRQHDYLLQNLRLQIKIVGLANSKKMVFKDEGIRLTGWKEQLENGEAMNLPEFVSTIARKNLRNAVFIDVTANDAVAQCYAGLLEKSVSVVACNKIAASSAYPYYKQLKDLAREYNSQYLFETNVGAGLPVIGTLNDLLRSGDAINRIEAVLSGTLNFVFNHYNGERPFSEVVRQAQQEGYTEPDPRLDLSGTDVMRKIMILARESGEQLEMEDITNQSFMPASCMQGSVENFYAQMLQHEAHFKQLYQDAAQQGKKLKFVASYENGRASVGLKWVDPQHDFYHLYGKDNVVLFYTTRYPEQPLVVKGAGAGAEVTASGVFADIMRAAHGAG